MSYRVRRIDANQNAIVAEFRRLGWSVAITSSFGAGFPDLVVASPNGGFTGLIEIKDGGKPPSARKLTPDEEKFRGTWSGAYYIIESIQDVLDLNRAVG